MRFLRSVVVRAAVGAACSLLATPASSQVPAGGDFLVTAYSTGYQLQARSAMAGDGRFVVAWTDRAGRDGSQDGVFAQLFDPAGSATGADFRVNTYTTGWQGAPVAAMAPSGDFVVAWHEGVTGTPFAQRYDRQGRPVGVEFQVNTYTTFNQGGVAAAVAPDGRFVLTWHGGIGGQWAVYARLFDPSGHASASEFAVSVTSASQGLPAVAMDAAGGFVVVWERSGTSIYGRRFTPAGQPAGAEFHVETSPGGWQRQASVDMAPTGEFVVAWNSEFQDGSAYGVAARRFAASGAPRGADFVVNTYTTGDQLAAADAVVMDARGGFTIVWSSEDQDGSEMGVFGQRFTAAGARMGAEFRVNAATAGSQGGSSLATDGHGNYVATWHARLDATDILARRFGGLQPAAVGVDAAGNGLLEPGESVDVRPAWRNATGAPQDLAGTLSRLMGPGGATYGIDDALADYGTVPAGAVRACSDCYAVSVSDPPVRPVLHWDVSFMEGLSPEVQGQQAWWPLHVGRSFDDVPASSPFYRSVETLLHRLITAGCGSSLFCPAAVTTREQVAAFVLSARQGPAYAPPKCAAPLFSDVPASSPFCRWIEELARRGVVSGCGGGNYCPADAVTRQQMAVFVLRTLDPALSPPSCTTPMFADVPASSPFCRWIEELARRGVVTGCGGGNYCPTAPVTREQMSVFIAATFGLTLNGP